MYITRRIMHDASVDPGVFLYVLTLGLAAASMWKLAIADRITQWMRYKVWIALDKAGGFVPYHLQYLIGCALCFPMWAATALFFTRQFKWSVWIMIILAARIVGYGFLRWLNETGMRDLPQRADASVIEWPPTKPTK